MTVVILGGTSEARALAQVLVGQGVDVVTTLAGATAQRADLPGRVRVGGFGSDAAMAAWLAAEGAACVVDATHPFASRMTARAAWLGATVPVVRLDRPGWGGRADAGSWTWVESPEEAVAAVPAVPGAVFLAVGRQELCRYAGLSGRRVVARVIDDPEAVLPASFVVVRARGPFTRESERAFFDAHDVAALVTKDAGGTATSAKLDVAAERGVPVVMVRRPALPEGLTCVGDVTEAAAWVRSVTG